MTTNNPAPDPSIQELLDQFAESDRDRLARAKARLKNEIIPKLKKWGVAKVEAEYSGYGDSGCINHIAYLDQHGQPLNMDMVRSASDPEIENVLYEFLPDGFEINEGSQGDVTIDVQAGTVKLEHEEHYPETESSTDEWEV
ncbi:MAG: DUF6878 family protein [Planctomycetia bacterium]